MKTIPPKTYVAQLDDAGLDELLGRVTARIPLPRLVLLFEDWIGRSNVGYLQRKSPAKWKREPFLRPRPTSEV